MVFFVCEGCNETLKKNQVDKHVGKCRNCYAVTCVDCSVTFYENDYAAHMTCVSEAEKHQGTLYVAGKTKVNPQEAWSSVCESAAERASEAPSNIRAHLVRMGELGNVPRNKKKFANFVRNSLRLYDDVLSESIWAFLEKIQGPKTAPTSAPAQTPAPAPVISENGEEEGKEPSSGKKRKSEEVSSDERSEKKAKKAKKEKKEKKEKK